MGLCGGGGDPTGEARALEAQRKANVAQGMSSIDQTFGAFNPEFYAKRAQDYTNYAMPQLYNQLRQTQKNLAYGLMGQGLQGSSAMQSRLSDLRRETDLQKQGIVDTGISQAQELRKQVENQRSGLVGQLNATGDTTAAAQGALRAVNTYTAPSVFSPISNLFGNLAGVYGMQQQQQAYNPQNYQPRYGLTSPLSNSAYTNQRR